MNFLRMAKKFLGIQGPISRSAYFSGNVKSCIKMLSANKQIQFLQVEDHQAGSYENGEELNQLWELACGGNRAVAALDVEQLGMSRAQISQFLHHIGKSKSVASLQVSSSGFKEFGMVKLWKMLGVNTSLELLNCPSYNVQRHYLSPKEIDMMIVALKNNKTLRELYLHYNEIGSVLDFETEFDKEINTFKELAIKHIEVGDEETAYGYYNKYLEIANSKDYKILTELRNSGEIDLGIETSLHKVWLLEDDRLKGSGLRFNGRVIGCFYDYFTQNPPIIDQVVSDEKSTTRPRHAM